MAHGCFFPLLLLLFVSFFLSSLCQYDSASTIRILVHTHMHTRRPDLFAHAYDTAPLADWNVTGSYPFKLLSEAKMACEAIGARLATTVELDDAFNEGADWCSCGAVRQQIKADTRARAARPSRLTDTDGHSRLPRVPGNAK